MWAYYATHLKVHFDILATCGGQLERVVSGADAIAADTSVDLLDGLFGLLGALTIVSLFVPFALQLVGGECQNYHNH
jgi:hypothetical protein